MTTSNEFGAINVNANQSAFAIGSENAVTNQTTNLSPEIEKLFSDLTYEINEKLSGNEKQEAEHDVNVIKDAVKTGNLDRAKKAYSLLSDGIRTFASVIAIGLHYGWMT